MADYAHFSLQANGLRHPSARPKPVFGTNSGGGAKTLAGLLLAAALAALLVVADQVISTWTDGNWLAAWVALWTVTFAALAFLASPLRRMATYAARAIMRRIALSRARREEAQLWEYARHDPRIMAEIRSAQGRNAA